MTRFFFPFFFLLPHWSLNVCSSEIKEDIENMKLGHVRGMMKRKVTKENVSSAHLILQLERLVKRIEEEEEEI